MTNIAFTEKVKKAVNDFNMFGHGCAVAVALSGGADSVSLLCALKSLEGELGITVSACHLNHSMRGEESDADMRFCEELCARLGVPLFAEKIDVAQYRQKHESGEECARRIRYGFFERTLARLGDGARLATAHNSNDCAETVLLNLMRGTGLKGLCGIPPVRGNSVRPLIYCTRAEVEQYLSELGEGFVTDRTNLSDDYTRNKVRHMIIPEMLKINGALFEGMTRMTSSLREDSDYLEEQARLALSQAEKGRGWDAAALFALPAPIRSRAVRIILSGGGIEPSALRINTAVSLLEKRSARYNPCKDRFFTIRKGVCFVEKTEQHIRRLDKDNNC